MMYPGCPAQLPARASRFRTHLLFALCVSLFLLGGATQTRAQGLYRELKTPDKVSVSIKNRNGRVSVIASDEPEQKVTIGAVSPGATIAETDIKASVSGEHVEIDVRGRKEPDRIDITVRVPPRAKIKVTSDAGAVDVVGNFAFAEVTTDTGTIHADVPLDSVKFNFVWEASRPRFLSDPELPKVKEKAGGWFVINGRVGDKKAKKEARIELEFATQRGVVLFNVDPSRAPSDLRDRALTEAARAIVRSGNSGLMEAIRQVSPKLFGDYARTLPPPQSAPVLASRPPGEFATAVAPQLMRVTANVTDRTGRAVGGLKESDFVVVENGEERRVTEVKPTTEPFNLVLLLDVSGSVEEHIDFIRKAARNFLATASAQDRIAIISFRDDIQVISNFTTDRRALSERLDLIEAGGSTALYDALAYVLVDTLKPLRGERTAVVIMSDGDDNRSFVPFESLIDEVLESGALVYPLYIPSELVPEASRPAPQTTLDPLRTRYLTLTTRAEDEGKRLASVSGGVYYPIKRIEDLQRAYDDVVAQLRNSYTITYASNLAESRGRRVRVRARREDVSVRLSPTVNVAAP
ncbi:MAG: VWA domain-containing protein [Acidobacteria bacterium]|nr:VWA domain-containing protein [Acidobacteriota bacterium]